MEENQVGAVTRPAITTPAASDMPALGPIASTEFDPRPCGYDQLVIGRRLAIRFTGDRGKPWFEGEVASYAVIGHHASEHLVHYDDGDTKWHNLGHEEYYGQLRWLDQATERWLHRSTER